MSLFQFEVVSVAFDGHRVLDDVSCEIDEHGITAIVGPSGAGKSTFLRLCNRLEVPSNGTVRFRGDDVAGIDPQALRRRAGMVFQQPTLFGGTVRDNLLVADPDSDDAQHRAVLEQVALDVAMLDRDADTLSGGEAQRACLARSLITDPEVLLLDEPTSALDAAPKRAFEETARSLASTGRTILWVTHERDQVHRVATRVIALERGRLVGVHDDPADLPPELDIDGESTDAQR